MTDDAPCFDRIVPRAFQQEALALAIAENPANAPASAAEAALLRSKRWAPGRTLRIRFLDGSEALCARVAAAAEEWTRHANIAFDFGDHEHAEIRISFAQVGNWSAVGTDALLEKYFDPGGPTINLESLTIGVPQRQFTRTVLHEFGHMLGLIHEHQNPAGGIRWDKEAVYREMAKPPNGWDRVAVDVNYFETYGADQTQYTDFDPQSIMLYAVPADWTLDRRPLPSNYELSASDKAFIRSQYP